MKRAIAALFTLALISILPAAPASAALKTIVDALAWRSVGPYIGGRVVAVAGVPSTPNLFYMGGVEGGIWKSDAIAAVARIRAILSAEHA